MSEYNHTKIEKKWQQKWEQDKPSKALNPGDEGFDDTKPSYYILDMFPYPSGSGLHVGHASGYIGTDIIARKKRMEGFNVLHPMGWDAFGLPAEQYAIQKGQHPRKTTDLNSDNFRKQLKLLGLSYDWDREIDTSKPDYYKWTQWLFLKLYEKGLVYKKNVPVWWCDELRTVLANEEVIDGRSERGNHPCERRPMTQWILKITAYAERLLDDLKHIDWPYGIKKQQQDWIGKSIGAEVDFTIEGTKEKIRVFTTRPDTLFGVTALVLAPENPLSKTLPTTPQAPECEEYIKAAMSKSERDRKAETKQMTGAFTGAYVTHPLLDETSPHYKIPIYIADYVIADYGTGAVMSVPAHDERDFLFAKTLNLPILPVIIPRDGEEPDLDSCFTDEGVLVNSGKYSMYPTEKARVDITSELVLKNSGNAKTTYKIRDWVFSRQRYWGEPFPLYLDKNDNIIPANLKDLPVELPPMEDFTPSADGSAPLNRAQDWINLKDKPELKDLKRVADTMPGWAGSCWYFLRFMDPHNTKGAFSNTAVNYWKQVDLYVGGASHAVMHLLYARFWHKVFFDFGLVPEPEPFKKLFNQGMVTAFAFRDKTKRLVPSDDVEKSGQNYIQKSTKEPVEHFVTKMAKSLNNVVNPDDVIKDHGCDTLRLYETFMGPLDIDKPWSDDGISGCVRFIKRFWHLFYDDSGQILKNLSSPPPTEYKGDELTIERALNVCLKRTNESFDGFNFNTAIAAFMEMLNEVSKHKASINSSQAQRLIKALFPFAPHIASELWESTGNTTQLDFEPWPKHIDKYLQKDTYELVISINGKVRKKLPTAINTPKDQLEALAKSALEDKLEGVTIRKCIVVPNKLVNFVVS